LLVSWRRIVLTSNLKLATGNWQLATSNQFSWRRMVLTSNWQLATSFHGGE
jgi:hypothetical protein